MGLLATFLQLVLNRTSEKRERLLSWDDDELLVAWGREPERSEYFEELLRRWEGPIFGFICRRVSSEEVAEDLTQEVFLRLHRQAESWRRDQALKAWLFRVARNLLIDRARAAGTRAEALAVDSEDVVLTCPVPLAETFRERSELRERLRDAMTRLSDEEREALILRHDEELTFREIAEVVGAPEGTIKSRVRYALEALRGHLPDYEPTRESA